ncbi:MAG: hypothetical protein MUC96_03025 [Myxococcaceae bacterium]|nr:hypothetical protein [Myxococcaceae bacterium]
MFRLFVSSVAVWVLVSSCGPVDMGPAGSGGGTAVSPGFGAGASGGGVSGSGGGAATGGGAASGGGSGSGGSCCINGAFYACATSAAFEQCSGFDVGACLAACNPMDFMCPAQCSQRAAASRPDPSACTRDMSRDGTCGSSTTCNDFRGSACTLSSQCSSNNCTGGYCRSRSTGSRCTLSSQCESNNCTDGCCRGTSTGSACTLSSQCASNNCTNGQCSGNGRGSACTLSSQCTSNNCTGGRCQ